MLSKDDPVQAKVKLKDAQGQEFFLLVTKVNLKGLLVGNIPNLTVDTPVSLELQLGDKSKFLSLDGAIHKFVDQPKGGKSTIVRFVNLSESSKNTIQHFITSSQRTNAEFFTSPSTQISKAPPSSVLSETNQPFQSAKNERTMVVHSDSITHLALQSPDREANFVASTVDEEAIHQSDSGLAGKTIIAHASSFPIKMKNDFKHGRKILSVLAILIAGGLITKTLGPLRRFLDQKFGKSSVPEIVVTPEPTFENESTEPNNTEIISSPSEETTTVSEPSPTAPPAAIPLKKSFISAITIEELEKSLVVHVDGQGNFETFKQSVSNSPKKLTIDLPDISKTNLAESTMSIGKTPLLRIRSREADEGIRLTLDLYPIDIPKFDIKPNKTGLDITLRR